MLIDSWFCFYFYCYLFPFIANFFYCYSLGLFSPPACAPMLLFYSWNRGHSFILIKTGLLHLPGMWSSSIPGV